MCILHVQYNLPSLHWVIWIIFGTFRWIYHAKSVYDVAYSFIPLRIGRSLEIVTSFLRVNAEFQLQGWENRWIHNAKDIWNTYKTSSTMFSPCGNTSPPTIVVIFHYFPVFWGSNDFEVPSSAPSRKSWSRHVVIKAQWLWAYGPRIVIGECNSYFDFKLEAKPGLCYCIWWWALKWAMPAMLVYGGSTWAAGEEPRNTA